MADVLLTPWVLSLALVLSIVGLLLATFMEQIQLVMKYFGAVRGRVAWGYNLSMKVMVVNRLGAVFFLLFMGLAIDGGTDPRSIATAFVVGYAILTAFNIGLAIWFRTKEQVSNIGAPTRTEFKYAWASALAGLFNLLGLSVPLILGAVYPDFRLTLANLSFIFNSICTLLIVFVIEHQMAKLIDAASDRLGVFSYLMIVARAPASALICLALLLSLQWLPAA